MATVVQAESILKNAFGTGVVLTVTPDDEPDTFFVKAEGDDAVLAAGWRRLVRAAEGK
jgi:hypothetical protein